MTDMKDADEHREVHDDGSHERTKRKKKDACYCLETINVVLVKLFYWFGYQVGLRPLYFIIIPFIFSAALTTGLLFIKYEESPMVLFIPITARFITEQRIVEAHFPMNYSHYYNPTRFTRHEGHSRLIITAKDKQSILRSFLWPEIMNLDERLRNITIHDKNGKELKYEDICASWRGSCIKNAALNVNEIVGEIENGTTKINYPLMLVPFVIPQVLGGVTINDTEGIVEDAEAIMIAYFTVIGTSEQSELTNDWEFELINLLKHLKYENITFSFYASRSLRDELKVKMDSCIPYIPLTGFIMVTACMTLLWMSDCVRSKPLIGVIGILSATMSTGASFGFLIYCGAIYSRLNIVSLFLVLGIGVDDIFVAVSAWQKTSVKDPVPKRLAQTYSDAAVSVTITSLTNALAFAVGTTTPIVIVKSFCLYSCVTIVFAYVLFVTFCGGFLAISGYMEEQGRHSLFLIKVRQTPKNASQLTKRYFSLCCASVSQGINTEKNDKIHTHAVSAFFRDQVGSLLCNSKFRGITLAMWLIYLAGAIYGLTVLKEGLYRHRMARDDSYLVDFFMDDDHYYRHLPYSIQVVITGNVTYSDPDTQKQLLNLQQQYEDLPYGSDSIFTQSWFRIFLRRLRRKRDWKAQIKDEKSFIKILREKFFANPNNQLSTDVEYNEDYSRITASRMVFQAADVKDVYDDVVMMGTYRKVGDDSPFNVTCFHLLYSLFDQHSLLRPLMLQSIMIAVILVMFVALLFIPNTRGSIVIASSIISIATGVLGYMAFWKVNLDHVSAGSIFMCIGFSVDFSAHITYTYLSSKEKTSENKIRDSLHSLGLPILQGGFTTILSLVTFLLIPGYGYRTFFKTIFLVTIFAAYHSIILIPLFLAKLEDLIDFIESRKNKKEVVESKPNETWRKIETPQIKAPNGNLNMQNNNDNETVIGISGGKHKEEKTQKTLTNGDVNKVKNISARKLADEENGIDNEAYISSEENESHRL